jgi:putative hydrolase of HD superfamily
VLGHLLTVAIFSYIFSLQAGFCKKRVFNNFFAALFHDLPEILTKDIVRPIKASISGLEDIIKTYEKKQVDEKILPLLPKEWHTQMQYFVEHEFDDKIIEKGNVCIVEDLSKYNEDKYDALDGGLNGICDKLCAYIEACMTLEYGIKSDTLLESKNRMYNKYSHLKRGAIDFKPIFDYFK